MFLIAHMIYSHGMPATEAAISPAILTAPGWVRVGITAERMDKAGGRTGACACDLSQRNAITVNFVRV